MSNEDGRSTNTQYKEGDYHEDEKDKRKVQIGND